MRLAPPMTQFLAGVKTLHKKVMILGIFCAKPRRAEKIHGAEIAGTHTVCSNSSSKKGKKIRAGEGHGNSQRALAGNAPRYAWHLRHSRQRGICNLRMGQGNRGFESHPICFKPVDVLRVTAATRTGRRSTQLKRDNRAFPN